MLIRAYAKLNLTLDICGVRKDRYHLLDSLFQSISIYDSVRIEQTEQKGINLSCLPEVYGNNIAQRAAELFFLYTGIEPGLSIQIEKRIPLESGLAGGSANGAAVLMGLNELFSQALDEKELAEIALQLGADVPFFLKGGSCRARGIGERLNQVDMAETIHYVILKPSMGISTPAIYEIYDSNPTLLRPDTQAAISALSKGDIAEFSKHAHNVLEPAAKSICDDIEKLEQMLLESGAQYAHMSGSGSSVFGIYPSKEAALRAQTQLLGRCPFCQYAHSMDTAILIES